MEIAPVLKWPGAKWRIADRIVRYLPDHSIYVEPFFGSGAVFFRKAPVETETINDIDGEVVNLFRVIRDAADILCQKLEMTPYARDDFNETQKQKESAESDTPIERARKFLVKTWQGYGGKTSSLRNAFATYRTNNVFRTKYWSCLPERILAIVERLKMVQIENIDARELIPFYNSSDVLLYVDPPYIKTTRQSQKHFYAYEYDTPSEHEELLKLCLNHSGPCVISTIDNVIYQEMLSGWDKISFTVSTNNAGSINEVVYLNQLCGREISLF